MMYFLGKNTSLENRDPPYFPEFIIDKNVSEKLF